MTLRVDTAISQALQAQNNITTDAESDMRSPYLQCAIRLQMAPSSNRKVMILPNEIFRESSVPLHLE